MPRYKRTFDEAELDMPLEPEVSPEQQETLAKLRNMWEFASFMQYIFLFGHVAKIDDDFDIDDLEAECLKPEPSEKLAHIGLQLLKYVSSHRGLTPEIFDEYTRRQYVAKAPRRNPYGEEEEPARFKEFDVFTKVRVLQQLSTWTLGNAERIRSMMSQDADHSDWRMEPLGWDKDDRSYFVLDDNRLYRRTDEPPPPDEPPVSAKSKSKSSKKSKSRGTRASKRRRIEESDEEAEVAEADVEAGAQDETVVTNGEHTDDEAEPGYGFTSKTWECVAITLEEYQDFMATIFRTRDRNEKHLRKQIEELILPVIEKRNEALKAKQMKKIRELENVQKMATAKRSSRLAGKAEKEKQERDEREAEEKRQADLRMAHEEQERQKRIEEGHESRRLTREQRVKEREVKRILHEEELAKIEEQATRASSHDPNSEAMTDEKNESKRMSERQLKTQKEQHKKELEKLAEEDDIWYFDCSVCGLHGENLDDGSHSIACERCNVWQHSECHGFSPKQAEKEGFHFVCATCKRKEADAKKPKIAPLKLSKNKQSSSPDAQRSASRPSTANAVNGGGLPDHVARQLDGLNYQAPQQQRAGPFGQITNGPSLSPYGQQHGPPGHSYPPVGNFAPRPAQPPPPQQPWQGSPLPPPGMYAASPSQNVPNGYGSPAVHHQQQHQYAHQNAVNSAGGHPVYQAPYQPQPNGYSPRAPGGMYSMTSPPPQPYYQPQHYGHQQPPTHLMNGFQSPVKNNAKPATSPLQPPQPYHGQTQQMRPEQMPPQQHLSQSPNANFPPSSAYAQHNASSPVKSSPPSRYQGPQQHYGGPQWNRSLAQTPQQPLQPPSANGIGPGHQTLQRQGHPSPAASNSNGVAADGMSGPWPTGSKAIPQKHDQSPAPPASSQSIGETKVVPPVALVPSPSQQMQAATTGPQSVPVKKMPGVGDNPVASAQPQADANMGFAPRLEQQATAPVREQ